MYKKKGSHVGMVLSFVIFITFLTFIYVAMVPSIKIEPSKSSLLEYLRKEITLQASDTLVSVTVTGENPENKACWQIDHRNFIDQNKIDYTKMGYLVKNKMGDTIPSLVPEALLSEFLLAEWTGEKFIKLYYSNENFENTNLEFLTCQEGGTTTDSSLGLVTSKKVIFESKMIELIERQEEGYYYTLKRDLKIPFDSDFIFSLVLANGTEIKTEGKNVSVNVFSGEYPLQYIDSEANTRFGTLKVKIW